MNEFTYIQLIEDYVNDNLTDEQVIEFQTKLLWDEELRSQFTSYKEALIFCDYLKYLHLKALIYDLSNEKGSLSFRRASLNLLKIAASLLLVVSGLLFLYANVEYCDDCLAPKPKLDSILSIHRCPDPIIDEDYYSIISAYKDENYLDMINGLTSYKDENLTAQEKRLALAVAYHHIRDFTRSEVLLSTNFTSISFEDFADWISVSNALSDKNNKSADSLLNEIIKNEEHLFFNEANLLKSKLNHPFRYFVF